MESILNELTETKYISTTDAFILKGSSDEIMGVCLSKQTAQKILSDGCCHVWSLHEAPVYDIKTDKPDANTFNSEEFTKIIAEHAQKTAQVSHDLEMKRIKAKMIADITLEIVRQKPESIVFSNPAETAKLIADEAFKDIE